MDAEKFGCFVANRRKELNMTQKDLAAKIQVTDKAVSKWGRGLGFPYISTIEGLADALGVSITELMKSEKEIKTTSAVEQESAVGNVLDIAKKEVKQGRTIMFGILTVTMLLCTIMEMVQSIHWNAQQLHMSASISWSAIMPGVVLIVYALICFGQGKKAGEYMAKSI